MISVVYRFFRPGSYFHARDNRLTVTSSSTSNFFKTFILDRQWCKGSYKWKITEWYLLFIVFFVQDPIFTRETIGWLWRHRHVQTFSKHLFWTRQWCKGSYKWKITEWYLLFIVFFDQDPIFTRETRDNRLTVTSSSRQTFSKHLFWTGSDASGLISWKLPSDICCLSFFVVQDPIFTRETIGWLWRHRHVKLFQNIYFGSGSDASGLISGKLPSDICCLSFFSSRILFSRERQ